MIQLYLYLFKKYCLTLCMQVPECQGAFENLRHAKTCTKSCQKTLRSIQCIKTLGFPSISVWFPVVSATLWVWSASKAAVLPVKSVSLCISVKAVLLHRIQWAAFSRVMIPQPAFCHNHTLYMLFQTVVVILAIQFWGFRMLLLNTFYMPLTDEEP